MNNLELSKWKKAKRTSERIGEGVDETARKLINKYATVQDSEKIETLDQVIEHLPNPDEERKIIPATEEELNKFREEPNESIKHFKIGEKEYRFNITENIMADILKDLVRKKGKENFNPEEAVVILDDYLGDKISESVHFKFFKIPENDRLKYYQLLIKHTHFVIYEKKEKDNFSGVWEQIIQPIMDNGRVFEISEEIIPILIDTDSSKTNTPFNQMILDCKIEIEDRTYYGLMAGKYFFDEENAPGIVQESESDGKLIYFGILSCYSKMEDGERRVFTEWMDIESPYSKPEKLDKYQRKLLNFFYSFCNFLNEPDVKIIEVEFSPKNNERRDKRGSMPLPANKQIRIYGKLREYIEDYNHGKREGFSHRFIVRGHFMHFRDKKRYSKVYNLSQEQLTEGGYQIAGDLIKKWKKPCIKGRGILINKEYKVLKGGKDNG